MTFLAKNLFLLIVTISVCFCLECNGKCKCHGTLMDCSSIYIKKPFVQMRIMPANITTIDLKRNNISRFPLVHVMYTNEIVKEIKLWFNEIQKVETSILGKLFPMLTVLQLHRNKITHITNGDFIAVNRLRVLDLGENQIISIEEGSFARLKMLKELNLDGNRLQSLLPDTFTGLKSLLVLKLNSNNLTNLDQKWLDQMSSLEELFAKNNRVRYIKPFNITWGKSLRKINLSDNQIQYLPNLPALENINAGNKAGEGWFMDLSDNPVNCNCVMTTLVNFARQNLNKAVCGIGMKCQLIKSKAEWTPENSCNTSLRMIFVDKYLKMPACEEPHQRLKVFKLKVKEAAFTVLQCVASGSLVPKVQINRLNSDIIVSTQIAKNMAIFYLESNESVRNFQCVAENNVLSVKSSEWMQPKKTCPNIMTEIKECKGDMISLTFPFTVFIICMTVTVAITVPYVWMFFSEEHGD